MAGTTLLYNTVYGEPCTLELRSDGDLVGTAGYAGADRDRGHWWTQDDRWYRQWHQWAYGEAVGLAVVVDGDHVRFYAEDGFMADTAVITRHLGREAGRERASHDVLSSVAERS